MRRFTAFLTIALALAARHAAAQPVAPYDTAPPEAAPPEPPPEETPAPPPPAEPAPLEPRLMLPPPRLIAPPPPPSGPPEIGLAFVQTALGTGAMFLGVAAVVVGARANATLGGAAILAGPALAGWVVCGLGRTSADYEGSCVAPVVGAYVGALLAIPAAAVGCRLDHSSGGDNDTGCIGGAIVGFLLGYFVGAPLGATILWHAAKHPRSPDAQAWLDLDRHPADRAPIAGTRLSTTLLALAF